MLYILVIQSRDSDSSRSRLGCVTPTRVESRSKKEESETLGATRRIIKESCLEPIL